MKRLAQLISCMALLIIFVSACSTEVKEPLFYEDGIVNLNGPWGENQVTDQTALVSMTNASDAQYSMAANEHKKTE